MAITGDLVSGQMYDQSESEKFFWTHYFKEFFGTMNGLDIPWGFVPGYYDYETGMSDAQMEAIVQLNSLHTDPDNRFVSEAGQEISHGFNFFVPIEANAKSTEIGRIWFFGTGMYNCIGQIGRDCIMRD